MVQTFEQFWKSLYVEWPSSKWYDDMVSAYKRAHGNALKGIVTSTVDVPPFKYDHTKEVTLKARVY